jgi:hypothetical protein
MKIVEIDIPQIFGGRYEDLVEHTTLHFILLMSASYEVKTLWFQNLCIGIC